MRSSAAILAVLVLAAGTFAQFDPNPPFISAAPTAYDAQIATAITGIGLMAKRAPSNNKYVTVGPDSVSVAGANNLPIIMPMGGTYVGNSADAGAGLGSVAPPGPSVLDKPGMTLILALPR
jgi:hypothetical protein